MPHLPPPPENPLVSIVTTCRNAMPFIRECVQSVAAQTHARVQHVVQDAASSDGTAEFLAGCAGIDFVSEPDSGQSDGLNRALARARGEIILLLNGDDALLPHACAWGVEMLRTNPGAGVAYGDELLVDGTGARFDEFVAPDYDFERLVCVEIVPPAQAAFIRRDAFEAAGLWMSEDFQDCADFDLWLRLGGLFPMVHGREFVTRYRWHDNKSRDADNVALQVEEKGRALAAFFNDPKNARLGHLRERAASGLHFWAAETFYLLGLPEVAHQHMLTAAAAKPAPDKLFTILRKYAPSREHVQSVLSCAPAHLAQAVPADAAERFDQLD